MAGEIATAYLAVMPSMSGFGKEAVRQIGPQARQVGQVAGQQAGDAFSQTAAKGSTNWLKDTAQGAIKNVALYGSMYKIIQGVSMGVSAMFDAMIGFNGQLEQATIGFETLLGSSAAAKDEMQWINDFAKLTPFRYGDLVGYSQSLIAMGFSAKQAQGVLQATGDAAAALGRGSESIQRINLALGQMWTKGKVQSQEMLQLTEAGIGGWQMLAKAYGVSVEEIQAQVTAGNVKATDAVPALIAGMNAQFGGLMDKQSQTYLGIVSNIQDTLQQQLAKAGEPLFNELTVDAQKLLTALSDPEVVSTLNGIGSGLATTAKYLVDAGGFAIKYRDAILEVAIAYGAMTVAQNIAGKFAERSAASALAATAAQKAQAAAGIPSGAIVPMGGGSIGQWKSASTAASVASAQFAAAQASATAAAAASVSAVTAEGNAMTALARTIPVADAAVKAEEGLRAAYGQTTMAVETNTAIVKAGSAVAYEQLVRANFLTQAVTEQTVALGALGRAQLTTIAAQGAELEAQTALTASSEARIASTEAQIVAEREMQMAEGASTASAIELATARKAALMSSFKTFAPMLGLLAVVDGYKRVSEAGDSAGKAAAGFAESTLGGAAAGFAFGGAAGAAIGAVAGLTISVWAYQRAQEAANKDTSLAQKALEDYGVQANLASLALAGITNDQLDAVGGVTALTAAMKAGTLDEFMSGIGKQSASAHEQITTLVAAFDNLAGSLVKNSDGTYDFITGTASLAESMQGQLDTLNALSVSTGQLDGGIASLNSDYPQLAEAMGQVTSSAYGTAYAADMQTGALGAMSKAAWDAVVAQGGMSGATLTAAVRMEGLAGVAGYATQMISGIPTGTQINFGTNAMEIADKIGKLYALSASYNNVAGGATIQGSIQQQLDRYKAQINTALSAPVTTLSLPTLGGSSGGGGQSAASKAADAAAKAAEDAAQKLASDQKAQVQFGDAFGTLMESALAGNFDEYRTKLQDEITSLTRDGYTAAADTLKRMSTALTTASLDYSVLTGKLKAASTAYDDLTGKMKDQYNTSRDLISGLGKATDAQSFDQLAYLLGETTSKALDYQAVLTQLKDKGLSTDLWNQLAQAGPTSAGLAQSILDQGQSGIDQLNTLSTGLLGAADSMGTLVADSMYQNGVDAMSAYIEGLKSGSGALEAQLQTIANNVLNQTAGAITPGNAGYSQISAAPTQVVNNYTATVAASSLGDLKSIQDFLAMMEQAKTTNLVNQAGTVTS